MDDRLSRLEAQLDALTRELAGLHERVGILEGRAHPADVSDADDVAVADAARAPTPSRESDTTAVVSLIGRTLVVLGGAYLLRALTDSGTIAQGAGVGLGMAYALTWIVMADRAGLAGRRLSAAFHGVGFVLIALPLLFEATARYHFLNPVASSAALGIFAVVSLGVAARSQIRSLGWITTLGALVTVVGLMVLTADLAPYAIYLVLLGVTTLWYGYIFDWLALRWPVAFVVDLTVLVLSFRAVSPETLDTPAGAIVVQLLLLGLYLGSFGARTLFLNRDVIPFEVVQSVAAIVVGLGGAGYVTRTTGVGFLPLGLVTIVFGGAAYAVAIAFVERRQGRRRNFYFYTSAALVFTMTGWALVLPPRAIPVAWAGLALVAALAGRRSGRTTFQAHGAVYAVGAAVASGLATHALHGLGYPIGAPHEPGALAPVVLAVLAACTWLFGNGGDRPVYGRIPRLLLLIVTVGGVLGLGSDWLVLGLGRAAEPGMVATIRTALLVAGALALAWAEGAAGFVEAGWLVYPLLAITGVKFVFEDLSAGRPATLFVAFALYGTALIFGPRLKRKRAA